ncbi:MAG: HlyD family efflux transporter periplasmic adaptor subunit [Chloroflexi bacterium]|nr:HlyD family efflux transporter periplasmic adaptor subunit [Chloroflexota bacterium]
MKKLSLSVIVAAVAVLLLSACSPQAAPAEATPTAARPQGIIAEGRLEPVNALAQAFTLPGQVAEVLVQDGETVQSGQPLVRLTDSPEAKLALRRAEQEDLAARQALEALKTAAESNLAQARLAFLAARDALDEAVDRYDANDSDENKARLDAARASFNLAEQTLAALEDNAGIDPDQQAAAEARVQSAKAALESAGVQIDLRTLNATLGGAVVDLDVQSGELVTAGMPVVTIADYSAWLVKTDNLTELEVARVSLGQKVQVALDALPEMTLEGEVTHINARYEEKRGDITYTVTIRLAQTDPQMRWGMTASVTFLP